MKYKDIIDIPSKRVTIMNNNSLMEMSIMENEITSFPTMVAKKTALANISKQYEKVRERISNKLLADRSYSNWNDLYYDLPYGVHQWSIKRSDQYKNHFPEEVNDIEALARHRGVVNEIPVAPKEEKGRKITTTNSAGQTVSTYVDQNDFSSNPIRIAVAPMREQAIEKAGKDALELAEKCLAKLAKNEWDINAVAPSGNSRIEDYETVKKKNSRRSLYNFFVTYDQQRNNFHTQKNNHYVIADQDAIDRFIENSKRDAASQYDAFVAKLIAKIGAVNSASIEGSHVWGYSILTVDTPNGVEKWKTQQITNISSLGKLFNQWPTRKLK